MLAGQGDFLQTVLHLLHVANVGGGDGRHAHDGRKNGSFVIRSTEAFQDSYFEQIRAVFEEAGSSGGERYIRELQDIWISPP